MRLDGEDDWAVADDEGYEVGDWFVMHDCPTIGPELTEVERRMPVIPYVRESRRLVGLHTLRATEIFRDPYPGGGPQQFRARAHFPSSVAFGDYAVDLHGCWTNETLDLGETLETGLPEGHFGSFRTGPFQIPFESLVPETVDGLLAGDKNVSASRLAAGALRLQPSTMSIGQGAGAIAGIAARHGIQPRDVPIVLVQDALVSQHATISIYKYADVTHRNPHWGGVQIVSTRELMVGDGATTFDVNGGTTRTLFAVVQALVRGLPIGECRGVFADLPPGHPLCPYAEALYDALLTQGCDDDPLRYCPDDPIDRATEAVGLVIAAGEEDATWSPIPHFVDVPESHWAFRFVQIAWEKGFMTNCGDFATTFCPDQQPTRGEFADDVRRTMVSDAEAAL